MTRDKGPMLCVLTAAALCGGGPALAQQALPAITVSAPHATRADIQVATGPAATARAAPSRRSRPQARSAAPAAAPSLTPPPQNSARGVTPIVADQFASVTVVPGEELRRLPGATLGDALFAKPGVTGSSFAPGAASRPIVRGLDNYRVRIQENGVGAGGVSEIGEDHGVPLDPLGASQIEVVRGPAALRWGSQAMGGVVNVANNRIPEGPPCADAVFRATGCARAESRSAISTVDNGLESALLLDAGRGDALVHADAQGRRASDYHIPAYPYLFPVDGAPPVDGRQPNSSSRAASASLGASWLLPGGGFVGVSVDQFNSHYRIPGLEPTATNTRIDLRQTRVSARGAVAVASAFVDTIRFWAGLTDYKHHESASEGGFDGVQQTFTSKEIETRVETQLLPIALPFATLTSAFGAQGTHQILTSPGREGGLYDPNRTKSIAGYLFNELRLSDALRMQLSGRIEHVQVSGSSPDLVVDPAAPLARDRRFTPKSGAVGFLHDLPLGLVGSFTAQYVERAPRAPELLSRGIHESTGTFDIGDPRLGVEAAKTVEIGLRRAKGAFRFEATVFHTQFDGFIFRNLTGAVCAEDFASCGVGANGELRQAVYAQRNATFRGGEFLSQLDLTPLYGGTFGVENQFDIVRAGFTSGGNVPRLPPARLGGGIFWRDANWLLRVNLLHAFAQKYVAAVAETPTAGYDHLKAEVSYRAPLAGGREMTLGVVGANLLNAAIRNHVSFRKDEVLMPGANIRLFANFLF